MRIALFFIVNIAVAIGVAVLSVLQDHSLLTVVLRVIGTLIVVQLAYVLWLFIVARVAARNVPEDEDKSAALPDKSLEDA